MSYRTANGHVELWCRPLRFGLLALFYCLLLHSSLAEAQTDEPLIKRNADWRYFASKDRVDQNWNSKDYDDSSWKLGPAGFGYGDADDKTILKDMVNRYSAVYIRRNFDVADAAKTKSLFLHVNYDDGFIAYLNGRQVVASHANRQDGKVSVRLHEAGRFESFEIEMANQILRNGRNVLAIEGHNASVGSSDFTLDPALLTSPAIGSDAKISSRQLKADLAVFEHRLFDQSSYLTRIGFDARQAIQELRESIDDETELTHFVLGLRKLVMQIGDCHANVAGPAQISIIGLLPFRFADTDLGLAALEINRDQPLDEKCPYVVGLDGVPMEKWLEMAQQFVANGSPQLRRSRSLDWMAYFDSFRDELKVKRAPFVTVSLASADGKKQVEKRLRLTRQGYAVAAVALKNSRMLDGNIGYLRIPLMDNRLIESVVKRLKEFRDTDGLIIDVRDNGGGTYAILRAIYPFFQTEDSPSYVTNIAAFRLSEQFRKDHIAYRPTFRADWSGWTKEERQAIQEAAGKFKPEWQPPKKKFSEWHYMVLNRRRSSLDYGLDERKEESKDDFFHYAKPVVVLSNASSFSATDGFLSAFADLPQVTIVGEPSGGGSGSTRRFVLPETGVQVALSSMASFRANGKTFDGNGIEVDIPAKPTLSDHVNGEDSVLERAVGILQKANR